MYMDGKQKVNIIYITTKCNLECEYCYESNKRNQPDFEHFTATYKQIDEFIEELERTEGDIQSTTIVVMGGDPSLAVPELEYLIAKVLESTKKMNKHYYATFTTNGVLLNNDVYYKKLLKVLDDSTKNGFKFDLEISYDGIGQELRAFPNGKSSRAVVENVLAKLEKDKYKFCISCTVTEKNYDKLVEEAVRMLETYKSCINLSFSFAYERIDQFVGDGAGFEYAEKYKPYMRELYKIYGIPICGLACGEGHEYGCLDCDKSTFDGNRYLSPTKGILTKDQYTEDNFGQF